MSTRGDVFKVFHQRVAYVRQNILSQTGIISTLLQPPETTIPENLPVKYKGVIQLKLNSNFYILNFLNNTFAMAQIIRRSVKTFSSNITVLFRHELLIWVQKIVQRIYSIFISYSLCGMSLRQLDIYAEGIVFRGVLSETKPTRIHSPPSYIIISYFRLSIRGYFLLLYQLEFQFSNASSHQSRNSLKVNYMVAKFIIFLTMKLNLCSPVCPKQRAKKLGLTSSRFKESQMSQNAKNAIEHVKRKDRSEINLDEWRNNKFYKKDATSQLFNCAQNITRVHQNQLSVEDFVERFQKKNLPLVIQGCTENWNVQKYWTFQYFYQKYKEVKFKIGEDDDGYKLRVPFKYYLQYLVYNKDDSPLYMFESSLQNNKQMLPILENYHVPKYFKDDLLQYAGQKSRPPYRWLLMGPERSGSTVHIDPLNTSAWNTSLQGHKRWVLFPEKIPKFIVKGKGFRGKNYQDEAINYFTQIIPKIIQSEGRQRLGIIQFIQKAGETVFIPGGWWHAVFNLDDTLAVTQNVMTHNNFEKVWRSIRCERRKFAHKYLQDLKNNEFSLYERAIQINKSDNYEMGQKYQRQSVSMSFTGTSSSSSSSSQSQQQSSTPSKQNSKRSRSQNSRQYSRSRNKKKQMRTHSLKDKKRRKSSS